MNKKIVTGMLLTAAVILLATASAYSRTEEKKVSGPASIRIGVTLYREDDTFISTLRGKLEECAKNYEQASGVKVNLDVYGAKGSQLTQNSQVERFISLDYDVLCVNIVDRAAASTIIDKAMAADIPIVFFNREPVEEDISRWEKLYYVGADAKTSATLQGQLIVDAWKKDPSLFDANGDGVVGYVLLEGETSHQDSLIRTEWSIQTLKDGGVPLKKITGGIANWERSQGTALMEQWLKNYPGEIELVISNNDDMALGAIDAIKRMEIKDRIKLVGIDGTPPAMEALETEELFGTVQCDGEKYAKAIFDISAALAHHNEIDSVIELDNGKYYRCPQVSLSKK